MEKKKNRVHEKVYQIKTKIKDLGFLNISESSFADELIKDVVNCDSESEANILLKAYKLVILEEKEEEFNKHIENLTHFVFEK